MDSPYDVRLSYNLRHIVIVCGYGCHLDTPLRPYLDRVVNFINSIENSRLLVIFCGGPTQQKTAPGVTEAALMADYVYPRTNTHGNSILEIEKLADSYTTFYNVRQTFFFLKYLFKSKSGFASNQTLPIRITIFCEATRSANVMLLARHFLLPFVKTIDDITLETGSWEGADPFKQAGNLVYNRLAIKYPWLGLAEREQRRRMEHAKHA